jgi:hypothetical protein
MAAARGSSFKKANRVYDRQSLQCNSQPTSRFRSVLTAGQRREVRGVDCPLIPMVEFEDMNSADSGGMAARLIDAISNKYKI